MKKLLLSLFLAAILFSCKSDDYTCPDVEGKYKGTLYMYENGKTMGCYIVLRGKEVVFVFVTSKGEKQVGTTYSCKNSLIIFDPVGRDFKGNNNIDLKKYIPLKYSYDAKRKKLTSVDDSDNTGGDVEVAYYANAYS